MLTVTEIMDFTTLNKYMGKHDFLPCDRKKIYDFINTENRMRNGNHKFVGGYLTRKRLILVTGYGTEENYDRTFLGIQDNFR